MKLLIKCMGYIIIIIIIVFKDNIYSFITHNTIEPFIIIDNIYDNYLRKENQNFLDIMQIDPIFNYDYTYSKVIFKDIYRYKEEVSIYYGQDKGLEENMAVIDSHGLIGIIQKVYSNSSTVTLISSRNSNISVKINNHYGILKYENNQFIVEGFTTEDEVYIDDLVYTSGLGHLLEGIPVGKVVKIQENGLNKNVFINVNANLNNINVVLVIKDKL